MHRRQNSEELEDWEQPSIICSPCVAHKCVCVGGGWWSYEENIWICFSWGAVVAATARLRVCQSSTVPFFMLLSAFCCFLKRCWFWHVWHWNRTRALSRPECNTVLLQVESALPCIASHKLQGRKNWQFSPKHLVSVHIFRTAHGCCSAVIFCPWFLSLKRVWKLCGGRCWEDWSGTGMFVVLGKKWEVFSSLQITQVEKHRITMYQSFQWVTTRQVQYKCSHIHRVDKSWKHPSVAECYHRDIYSSHDSDVIRDLTNTATKCPCFEQ